MTFTTTASSTADVIRFPADHSHADRPAGAAETLLALYHATAKGVPGAVFMLGCTNPPLHKDAPKSAWIAQKFPVGASWEMSKEARNRGKHSNVYFGPALMRRDLPIGQRGTETDIVAVCAIVLEEDGDTGKLVTLPAGILPSFDVVTSRNPTVNRHYHFVFEKPLPPKEAKALAELAYRKCGGDSGGKDIAHVWRIPETLNHPCWRKIVRGRPKTPQPVELIGGAGEFVRVDALRAALEAMPDRSPRSEGSAAGAEWQSGGSEDRDEILARLSPALRARMNEEGQDRSSHCFHVIMSLIEDGLTDDEILIVAQGAPFARKFWERGDLDDEIRRTRARQGEKHDQEQEQGQTEQRHQEEPKKNDFKITTAAALLKTAAPARKWVVDGWIPDNTTTLFSGDGGVGKSVVAVQLMWACATGREWLYRPVKKCPALYVSCEDDTDEVHFRLEQLHKHDPGVSLTSLEGFHILDLVGEVDAEIASFQQEKINLTKVHKAIEAYVQEHKIGFLVLDASADVFGGDEISKRQVRAFIRALNGLARKHSCAVLLIAHPSKSGMKDGSGYSGNVAWNGSVRARLYLEAVSPKDDEDEDGAKDGPLVLRLPKSNRSRAGQKIYLRWKDGRFVADSANGGATIEQAIMDEELFLRLLDKIAAEGRHACVAKGVSYAPSVFAQHPLGKGVSNERFRQAMENLLSVGKIKNQAEGSESRRRWRLVRVQS